MPALRVGFTESIVHPRGEYHVRVTKVALDKRRPFGAPQNAAATEPFFKLETKAFDSIDDKGNPVWSVYEGEAEKLPVQFTIKTGVNYGSGKAFLTKMINRIVGRPLTKVEAAQLDMGKLEGLDLDLTVSVENGDDGDYNSIDHVYPYQDKAIPAESLLTA